MIPTVYKDIYIDGTDIYHFCNNRYYKLTPWVDNVGYYQVAYRIDNNKRKFIRVHRIIAQALLPNPNNLPMVNHKDGNKLNNNIENLEWCTNTYNTQEAYNKGLYYNTYRCPIKATHKKTQEEKFFKGIRECAEQLQLNRKTITSILKGIKKTNNYDYYFEYYNE